MVRGESLLIVALLALAVAPVPTASAIQLYESVPCLVVGTAASIHVDDVGEEGAPAASTRDLYAEHFPSSRCRTHQQMNVSSDVGSAGARGLVAYTLGAAPLADAEEAKPLGLTPPAAPVEPLQVELHIAFLAEWKGGCEDLVAWFEFDTGDGPARATAPTDPFRALCGLAHESGAPDPLPSALAIGRDAGEALLAAMPSPLLGEAVAAAAALAVPLGADPGAPVLAPADGTTVLALGGDTDVAADVESVDASTILHARTPVVGSDPAARAHVEAGSPASPGRATLSPMRAWRLGESPPAFEPSVWIPAPPVVDEGATDAPTPASPAPPPAAPRSSIAEVATQRATPPPEIPPVVAAAGVATGVAALVLLGIALYQRIARPAALAHPLRAALFEACRARGHAATSGQLALDVGAERKTVEYHLRYLARLQLLAIDLRPSGIALFRTPETRPGGAPDPVDDAIARFVRTNPGAGARGIAEALGMTRPRVERHLRALSTSGALEARASPDGRAWFPLES